MARATRRLKKYFVEVDYLTLCLGAILGASTTYISQKKINDIQEHKTTSAAASMLISALNVIEPERIPSNQESDEIALENFIISYNSIYNLQKPIMDSFHQINDPIMMKELIQLYADINNLNSLFNYYYDRNQKQMIRSLISLHKAIQSKIKTLRPQLLSKI